MEPKRNTMKKPVKSDNAVEKALMDGVGKWVNAFNAFPIPYEIDLATLAGMVRTAYEEVATQPSFRVTKAHKGPSGSGAVRKRLDDPGKFYPHSPSAYEKKKMPPTAGCRRTVRPLRPFGGFAKAAALKTSTFWKPTGQGDHLAGRPRRCPRDERHLDGERSETLVKGKDRPARVVPRQQPEGYHLTVWCKARGTSTFRPT